VQFVQYQELDVGDGGVHEGTLLGPGQHELQHDEVSQQKVRRICPDLLFLLLAFLPGVTGEAHRAVHLRPALVEPLQGLHLGIDEGVHGVDDQGPDPPLVRFLAQDLVEKGQQVGQAFAGPGAGGHQVGLSPAGDLQGLGLMAVQAERLTGARVTENPCAVPVEVVVVNLLRGRRHDIEAHGLKPLLLVPRLRRSAAGC
jgi:hypothetical protein